MKVIIDNGHGINTPGKCSPDGKFREYAWAREIAKRLQARLAQHHIDTYILVPEDTDIKLIDRCKRANKEAKTDKDTILVSIHVNAFGCDGKWHDSNGWGVYVSLNASSRSKKLASLMTSAARTWKDEFKIRVPSSSIDYWSQNLAICRDTSCPAVLVENLFQDNKKDVEYLMSDPGKVVLTEVMVEGICNYFGLKYSN